MLEQHLAVNLFGTYRRDAGFLPLLSPSRGTIINNVSLMALRPISVTPAYSISKAACVQFDAVASCSPGRTGREVSTLYLTGPTDTDMTRGFDIPKASPESVARAIFDGVKKGEEDIFPDPMSASLAESWRGGPVKAFERQYAAFSHEKLSPPRHERIRATGSSRSCLVVRGVPTPPSRDAMARDPPELLWQTP